MINLKTIDKDNFLKIIALKVRDEQKQFILDNATSLAQAYVQKECVPMAIYNRDIPIGFLMYCKEEDNQYWIYRFMIDVQHQCRGYGRKAFELLLDKIKQDNTSDTINLNVNKDNEIASFMFEDFGFDYNLVEIGYDKMMVLKY